MLKFANSQCSRMLKPLYVKALGHTTEKNINDCMRSDCPLEALDELSLRTQKRAGLEKPESAPSWVDYKIIFRAAILLTLNMQRTFIPGRFQEEEPVKARKGAKYLL